MFANPRSDLTRLTNQAPGICKLTLLAALLLAAVPAGSQELPGEKELYKLKANAPEQALSDTVYRYLSERAAVAYGKKHFKEAELLYSSALASAEKAQASAGDIATLTANLAAVYRDSSQFERAKPLFGKALQSSSNQGGDLYKYVLRQYALFLERTGRSDEARFAYDAASHGHKLMPGPGSFANQSARLDRHRSPLLLVHPLTLPMVPITNQNDPYLDVSLPLPQQLSSNGHPWSFGLQFAECPPRERWAAFDTEQRSTLNQEWAAWLQKLRTAMESAIAGAPDLPKQGRYHLAVGRSGCINNVETLSNPAYSEDYLSSIGSTVSRLNNCSAIPFPETSQMEEIHVVLNFEKQEPEKLEIDWSQFKPQVSNGYTVVYPIAGAGWVGRPWHSYLQPATNSGNSTAARSNPVHQGAVGLPAQIPAASATLPLPAAGQQTLPGQAIQGLPASILNPMQIPGVLLPGRPAAAR